MSKTRSRELPFIVKRRNTVAEEATGPASPTTCHALLTLSLYGPG